jgi:hypothetical protein
VAELAQAGDAGAASHKSAKIRIMAQAEAYNAIDKRDRHHIGPLTRTTLKVLHTLLFKFLGKSGRAFPSYETIAKKANCCRDTVCEAITALENANVLVGSIETHGVERRLQASNAYIFHNPPPDGFEQSENPIGRDLPFSYVYKKGRARKEAEALAASLDRLGRAVSARS